MGTTYSVRFVTPSAPSLAEKTVLLEEVEQLLEEINDAMSTYREGSELSRLNRAPAGTPIAVSQPLLEVLVEAERISESTGGAFDVTVGPLVNAYGFGPGGAVEPPGDDELAALRERTGFRLLTIDRQAATVTKARDDLYVDLSALAKGYGVDRVARRLEERGLGEYMVEIGGEVRTAGRNLDGEAWRIGIERPAASFPGSRQALQRIVSLTDRAMATSGDYRNFREIDGRRLTHIVDPRSGLSVHHRLASVSVIDEHCMTADALATALIVLGPDEGPAFAEAHDIAALFLLRGATDAAGVEEYQEWMSPAWDRLPGDLLLGSSSGTSPTKTHP